MILSSRRMLATEQVGVSLSQWFRRRKALAKKGLTFQRCEKSMFCGISGWRLKPRAEYGEGTIADVRAKPERNEGVG